MANRLAEETSPYLRQHADNPVDWWAWGDGAFEEARRRDVPVLLSVGYSACHWCHVMAHESFEDPATAAVLNELFVNIKVDREERPDVDAVYMEAVQAMTGHGGWPMTVWLDHDGRPFFGGTYFPKTARGGMHSFVEVSEAIAEAWRERRRELGEQAAKVGGAIGRLALLTPAEHTLDAGALDAAAAELRQAYDEEWGGFGRAPKFPQTMNLELLLRHHHRTGAAGSLDMVTNTLAAMASGGMYDHVGGGFARYSVDAFWMVPHFEKMLYDQALLARAYLHAWQVTHDAAFLQVAGETIEYVRRDLRHAGGGFFSAEDADSEGEEGKFYVWRPDELREAVGDPDLAAEAMEWYGVTAAGNFEGANILHRPVRGELLRPPRIEQARERLFAARERRVRPGLDDKVLTEWNGLFLSTLAEAAAATANETWRRDAVACGEHLLANLRRADGRWLRSWQADGGARHLAYAADHAALVDAFCRLAECTGDPRWITEATAVADALVDLFWDDERGGVFTTGRDAEALVMRPKDLLDNATPSANAAAAVALARLAALTGRGAYAERAEAIVRLVADVARQHPSAFAHIYAAVDLLGPDAIEIAVVGDRPDLVRAVQSRYLPGAVLAWGEPWDSPLWEGRRPGLAYVCQGYACKEPVDDVDALLGQLP